MINSPYEWKYHRLFANMVSVSGLFLVTNDIKRSLPGCILHTARCSLTFQAQDVPVSWLVLPLRQSNMPCVTREQLQGLMVCPEMTVQSWHLIGTGSNASSSAMFFICAKLQTTVPFFHETFHKFLSMLILILYSVKPTSSAVNIAQGPSEILLQLHRTYYLLGPQALKRLMF